MTFRILALLMVFAAPMFAQVSFADETGTPSAPAVKTLPLRTTIEFREGVTDWSYQDTVDMSVPENGQYIQNIHFVSGGYRESFKAHLTFVAKPLDNNTWELTVTRRDTVNGYAYGKVRFSKFTIARGATSQVVLGGTYKWQRRDLRLTITH